MRNINHQRGFHNRSLTVLVTLFLLAFSVASLPRGISSTSRAAVRKIHAWQQESREMVRLSIRVYRLYKNCSQQPVMQAQNCQ